ncbi:MAG: ftsH [Patescibacteria group bacterium]|nr:ftsH [Patescibacteria group bacterium]
MSKKQKDKKVVRLGFFTQIAVAILVFAALSGLYTLIAGGPKIADVSLSQAADLINAGNLKSVVVSGDTIDITGADGAVSETKKEPESSFSETLKNYGVTAEKLAATPITVKTNSGIGYWLITILPILLPILFMGFFIWFLMAQMRGANGGGGMKAFSFGQSKARVTDPNDKKKQVTFADVAGNEEAKQELLDVVDFLKTPKKYFDVGAKIPKGVLLTGSPGTGKTLLARAVAGEAGVPFFHLSGSEFVEMFVGVGASRVRDLFDSARAVSPAIIFIDEIDAVGRSRGVGIGGGNDEREQTLNQILVEMDGFEPTEKIVVMAATNRADVLDSALLRPGRFDRRVFLTLPDRKEREAILNIHSKEKPLAEGIDFKMVAARTPGFSGADLESLMNEAAIHTARDNRVKLTQMDILSSVEKVMIGPERKSHLHTERERKIVAYHEAGHAILSSTLEHADPVHKVTIIPRGGAGGYTLHAPLEERKLETRAQFLDDIAVSLGGYAVEKMIFGDVTTGPSNDLQVSSKLARDMVTKWGMSDVLGPVAYDGNGRSMFSEGVDSRPYSEQIEKTIDSEVSSIMNNALARANETLTKYKDALEAVVKKLLEVETLEQAEYNEIISKFGITPKTSSA